MKLDFVRIELEAKLVEGFAKMDEDRLELVVGGGYNGDVVRVDDDPRTWTSVGMFNVLYDRPH